MAQKDLYDDEYYIVEAINNGESLSSISRRYRMKYSDVQEIMRKNGLEKKKKAILPGRNRPIHL